MTDARREWISKRAYTLWEEAGRPHGRDGEHWQQAERERDEFERVALATHEGKKAAKPVIELSRAAKAAKPKKAVADKATPAKAKVKAKAPVEAARGEPH
ncbi:DUF2934 domain-containing protein [Shinella pollutisoli]|uniref:DUF2934 domain-containing protein n=1 Tax=Shinella pollutisoli TaxID=2250594 RepID=A0ABV7DN34_9HYPH|nr:DUF2934 domain-containing protein [Shinella pollutisoli]